MKRILFIFVVLITTWSISAYGQYNPTNPGEPGTYYTLKLKCEPKNAGSFNIGTETVQSQGAGVSLRAYTNSGYKFVQWEENGKIVSSSSAFNYTMPGYNSTLVAKFEYDPLSPEEPKEPNLPKYAQLSIKVSPSGGGYLNVSSSNKYEVGTSVKLETWNYTNYVFKNWTQDGEVISTSKSFNYVVKEDNPTIIANYQYSPNSPSEPNKPTFQRKLYLNCNPGGAGYFNISSGNVYASGSSVTLKAYSNKNYVFKNWTLNGEVISNSYTMSFTMPETDTYLVANYDYIYSPGNPNEPNSPTDQDLNIYGMTESIYLGQTINYPIYLRNNQEVYGMIIDIRMPESIKMDLSSLILSSRGNGHSISYEQIENDYIRFSIVGDNPFGGDNGKIFEIPITALDEAQANVEHTISITHGVVILKNGVKVPVLSRDGGLKVKYVAEGEIYARYSYDKFHNRVKFNNQSADEAHTFEWDFGDGNRSNEENPLHTYLSPGTYSVKLTVTSGEQSAYYEQQVLINDKGTWEASGNFYLTKQEDGLRNFHSYSELIQTLSESRISGDIIVNAESGQTFEWLDTLEAKKSLNHLYQQLQQGNYRMVIQKASTGSNPIIEYGHNGISNFDKDFIDLVVKLGQLQTCSDVGFKFWGVSFNPSAQHRVPHQDVCTGYRTEAIDFSDISTDLQFSWTLSSNHASLSGVIEKGTHAIPAMNIINEGNGDAILNYIVTASYENQEFAQFEVKVTIHPALNGLFSNLEPKNGSQFDKTNITLSWNNIENALYDVYLWDANEEGADEPIIESTSNIRVNISKYCQNGIRYKWFVRAHNNCQEIFSDTLSFNVGSLPDLHVSKLSVGNAVAGEEMEISWTVTNDGNGPVTGEWKDYIWLVPDVYVGTSSVYTDLQRFHPKLLKTVGNLKALKPGESYENSVQIQLDERIYGDYWIIVTSDMHDVKDIQWQAVNNAVPNPYTPSVTGTPYNYLYAETNASYNKISEANESTVLSDNFSYIKIKIAIPGLVDLTVSDISVDVNNIPGTTTTNIGTIRVEPTPHTTLGIAESKDFYSGKWLTVTATIKNIGALKLERTKFSNVLYMSHSPNRDNMDDLTIVATKDITTFIDPDATAKVTFDVKVPFDWYGDTYFYVFADINDVVYELASKENNWGNSKCYDFKLTPSADFLPSNLKTPNTIASQTPFNIQYEVKNVGPNIPTNSAWVDKFYLGKNENFDDTAVLVGQSTRRGYFSYTQAGNPGGPVLIPASKYAYYGDNYSENLNITVDDIDEGDYYLFVKVDGNNQVIEEDGEENNIIRSGIISCRKPDLQAEIISIDADTILTSSTMSISWKIKNLGRGVVKNLKIRDAWYASKNQDGASPMILGEFENELYINPGDEQILRANVKIPQKEQLDGLQYIFMRINTDHKIEEVDYTNNQTSITKKWFHFYQEKPAIIKGTNIFLADINIPSQGKPNDIITISYSLKNDGNKKIDKEITQEVYFSSKVELDHSAVKCEVVSQQGSSIDLGAEDETKITLNIKVPDTYKGGSNYLHIVLDKNNELQETYTKDNSTFRQFYVNGNLPLVEVEKVHIPDTIMSSNDVTVKWKTSNVGEWQVSNLKVGVFKSADGEWDRNDEKLASITIPYLEKGETISNSATINIPDRNHGKWNLIIKADYDDKIVQLKKGTDNVISPITVGLSPIPDLVATSLAVDGNAWSGQKIAITTTFKNQGVHATRQTRWSEDYYLAQSNILNVNSAIKIGSRVHVGALKPKEEYKSVLSVTLPPNIEGNYMVFAVIDGGDAVYESDENNNLRSIPLFINGKNASATDLKVTNISSPSEINAGEMFTLKYDILNQGEFQAKGLCREVLYLSKDNILDLDDPIVGTVSGDISIMPGGSCTRSATGRITNVPEGLYYLIVKTNSTRSIAELNDDNNATLSASQVNIAFPSIALDETISFNTSGYYKLTVPEGFENRTIGFYLNQSKENAGALYVSYESVPTTATYEESSTRPSVEQQEVVMSNVRKGNYYILAQDNSSVINRDNLAFSLDGQESIKEVPFTLSAKELQFGASSLSIHEGGNGGWISTHIKGAFLDSIMDFRLVNKESTIPVEILHFKNSTSSIATFNLNNAAVGQYDVVSELPNGTTSVLPGAFTVIPSTSVNVEVKLEAPTSFRPHTYTPMTLYYFNNGTNDVELYEFLITLEYGYIAATMDELDRNKQKVLHVRPDYERNSRGYISLPPGERIAFTFFIYNGANEVNDMIVYVVK